jgi:hypothetical protein
MLLEQLKGNTYDTSFEQNIKGGFLKRFLQIHGYVLDAEPFTPPRQKGYDNMIGGEMNDTESGSLLHKLDGVGKMFNGSIFGALRANYASNKFGTKLEDFLKQAATLVHNHSQSLRGQNVPNGLKTNKIVEAEKLVRAAAQEMALDYMSEHYYLFNHPKNKNDEITKHFFNKVQDEFKNLLQTTVNAVALAAYKKPEPAYLPPI